jgi:hypothetical protein
MKTTFLLSALLFTACGDNLHPEDSQDSEDQTSKTDEDFSGSREIDADIFIETITCTETIARFEAGARYTDDGSPVAGFECLWTFDDGTTSSECVGEHLFAAAGTHDFVLQVTDPATGATDIVTQTRFFHPPLELSLDVTGDDLSITWNASSNTGGEQHVFVTPAELIITDDPNYHFNTQFTLPVKQAGTYTVTYDVEDERGVSEICSATIVKQITLVCDGDGHVH